MFRKVLGAGVLAAGSSGATYYYIQSENQKQHLKDYEVTPEHIKAKYPHLDDVQKWKFNWDNRENEQSESKYATRNILLIRHGQYDTSGETDNEQHLTDLGKEQTRLAGARLAALFNSIKKEKENTKNPMFETVQVFKSTKMRAMESAVQVESELKKAGVDFEVVEESDLLREHRPYPYSSSRPDKPHRWHGKWDDVENYCEPSATIEEGFQKFMHRAPKEQAHESFEVFVGHANVHRYFVMRLLQLPPEAWLRTGLPHGSITWLRIYRDGRATMRAFGDAGFIPVEQYTIRNLSEDDPSLAKNKKVLEQPTTPAA